MDVERGTEPDGGMVAECIGRLILVRCGDLEPTEPAWRSFLTILQARPDTDLRGLVVTAGGAPSAAQQKAFLQTVARRTLPFVILSDDPKVRFIISMLAMLTKRIRSFSLSDVEEACTYLDLAPDERQRARVFVAATRASFAR